MNEKEIESQYPDYMSEGPGDEYYKSGYVTYSGCMCADPEFPASSEIEPGIFRIKIGAPELDKIQLVAQALGHELVPCEGGLEHVIELELDQERAFGDANCIAATLSDGFDNCGIEAQVIVQFNYTEFTMRVLVLV